MAFLRTVLPWAGVAVVAAVPLYLVAIDGKFGNKKVILNDNLDYCHEIYRITGRPWYATVIVRRNLPQHLRLKLACPDEDPNSWTAFVNTRVVYSFRPIELVINHIPFKVEYELKLKAAMTNPTYELETQRAIERVQKQWLEKYPSLRNVQTA